MNNSFDYHKNSRPCFEIKQENLEQFEMPNMVREPILYAEERQTG